MYVLWTTLTQNPSYAPDACASSAASCRRWRNRPGLPCQDTTSCCPNPPAPLLVRSFMKSLCFCLIYFMNSLDSQAILCYWENKIISMVCVNPVNF